MQVKIYQPSKTATQSGRAKTGYWLIEPELASRRSPDALMGWQQADDTLIELLGRLKFPSVEAATAFAEKQGLSYSVVASSGTRHIPPKNYLDNFRTRPTMPSASGTR